MLKWTFKSSKVNHLTMFSFDLQTLHYKNIAKMYIVIFAKEGIEPKDG